MSAPRCAVILAGGLGSRLTPLATAGFPKQFFRLPGKDKSLLRQTAEEAFLLPQVARVLVVAPPCYEPLVRAELAGLAVEFIAESRREGTAGAAVLAAQHAGEDALLWLLPCDHVRSRPLVESLDGEAAFASAENGYITTFGLSPQGPDSRYGYLVSEGGIVQRFVEKPPRAEVENLLAQGNAYWNSGMFVLRAGVLLEAVQRFAPEVMAGGLDAPLSLDYAVMEYADNLRMLPFEDAGWSDIGGFNTLGAWWDTHAPHLPQWDFGNGVIVQRDNLLIQKACIA